MKRSMMQVYVKNSLEALKFYQRAFDAKILWEVLSDDKTHYFHSEIDVFGQVLSIAEQLDETVFGNTMQFCLHLGEGNADLVHKIFNVLKEDAELHGPVGDSGWSKHMFSLVDKYGVHWCIFE